MAMNGYRSSALAARAVLKPKAPVTTNAVTGVRASKSANHQKKVTTSRDGLHAVVSEELARRAHTGHNSSKPGNPRTAGLRAAIAETLKGLDGGADQTAGISHTAGLHAAIVEQVKSSQAGK